jgi:hypothetical protein
MLLQPGFRQIHVALNGARDFIADHLPVAKFIDGHALNPKRLVRKAFVFRRKEPEQGAGAFRFSAFHLPDVVLVFDPQAL